MTQHNAPFARSINGLLEDIFQQFPNDGFGKMLKKEFAGETYNANPRVNIFEDETGYHLSVLAAGFQKEDFKVQAEGNLLTISAEVKAQPEEKGRFVRKEFQVKPFKRSFSLDDKIDSGNILAKYENGVLKLLLPKKAEVKQNTKEIVIQ
jgi:HSP20 family protein